MITIPHLSQLQYAILDGHPSLEPLRIMREQSIRWASWNVTFYILGASHAVRFHRQDKAFTEMLACLPSHAPSFRDSAKIFEVNGIADAAADAPNGQLRISADPIRQFASFGLTHQVEITCCVLDGDQLAGAYGVNEIAHAFPIDSTLYSPDPVTRVGWAASGSKLEIETIHSYPEEALALRTLTIFREQGGEHNA